MNRRLRKGRRSITASRVLVLLSTAGGGDRQPVVALARLLQGQGYDVTVLCDPGSSALASSANLPFETHDVEQVGYISGWIKALSSQDDPANPLREWARDALPSVLPVASGLSPDLIVGSLFCMGLAERLSSELGVPWCFVNPSFYFGRGAVAEWNDDWHGPYVPRLARECFAPLVAQADLVLHATDPVFDEPPRTMPPSHHYVGFLQWEPPGSLPAEVENAKGPLGLVTASTSRPADEQRMLAAALSALDGGGVRPVLTLPKEGQDRAALGDAIVTGFTPHLPILERAVISVNQAGHGVVSKCLSAGVPMVLLPWDADQPGVARRAANLGTAVVVPRAEVTHDTVREAVEAVLGDERFADRAGVVARQLAGSAPGTAAVAAIDRFISASW